MVPTSDIAQTDGGKVVEYQASEGQIVKLGIQIVKKYLCPRATDMDAATFVVTCRAHQLDPFRGDVHLVKYDAKSRASIVVTRDYYLRRAARNPKYRGFQSGLIMKDADGNITEEEGAFMPPGLTMLGGWCKVYIDGYDHPIYARVGLSEFNRRQATWKEQPGNMIVKTAESHAHRKACPNELGGLYTVDEMEAAKGELERLTEAAPELGNLTGTEAQEVIGMSQEVDEETGELVDIEEETAVSAE